MVIFKMEPPDEAVDVVLPKKDDVLNDSGTIIIKGNIPGTAKVKSVNEIIEEETKQLQEGIKKASDEIEAQTKPEVVKVSPPEDMIKWLELRHALKKIEILRISDPDRLKYIAKWDTEQKVLKLIDQRLKELQKGE